MTSESGYCKHRMNKWTTQYVNGVPIKIWVNELKPPTKFSTQCSNTMKKRPDMNRDITEVLYGKNGGLV